jgi:hypothetical protein
VEPELLAVHVLALVAGLTREETTMAVQEVPQEQRELIEELARFRAGLEPLEREILDAVVHEACEPSGVHAAKPGDGAPSEDDRARLVDKIQAFERTLPDERRQMLDAILAQGGGAEADVEAHRQLLWARWGGVGPAFWVLYGAQCGSAGGSLEYVADWWSGGLSGTYQCWIW